MKLRSGHFVAAAGSGARESGSAKGEWREFAVGSEGGGALPLHSPIAPDRFRIRSPAHLCPDNGDPIVPVS